jgi:ferredoxin-type protein NapH
MNRLRRICQWSAIAILLLLPVISFGAVLYQTYGAGARNVRELGGPWEAAAYAAFSWLFGSFEDAGAVGDLFQGGYWSITLFGVTITDPLAFIGHALASGSVFWPMALAALAPLLIAAIAGRAFCGWVCPVNTLLEINARFRRWLERRVVGRRIPALTISPRARYLVVLGGLLASAVGGFNAFVFMLPYVGLARDVYFLVFGGALGTGVLFLTLLFAVELLLAPRLWCRSLCPTGLLLSLAGRFRRIGIDKASSPPCPTGCHLCITTCPVGVNPREGLATDQCLLCTECVSRCPEQILSVGVIRHRSGRALDKVIAPLAALVVLLPLTAAAHHIEGLPHYGYIENYPQTPTREERVLVPPYAVTVTTYQLDGINSASAQVPADAMVYVSIADTRTGRAYVGPVKLRLDPVGMVEGGATIRRSFKRPLTESVYQVRASLPAPAYDLTVHIGAEAVAKLQLELRSTGINPWLMASIAVLVLAFLVIVALTLRRRMRTKSLAPAPGKSGGSSR